MADDPKNQAGAAAAAPASARILIVEDDFLIRMMLSEVLMDDGFQVVEAGSGDDALPLIDSSIAVLVTDLQLPGTLDGQALVAAARQARPELPVIYTSGRMVGLDPPDRHTIAVSKPYQSSEICAAIRQMLAAD